MNKKISRILFIGKNEDVNEILALMLVRRGFSVIFARTGKEVLNETGDNKPDVIIFDIERWGIEEMEINEKVKTDKLISGVPIIFCIPEYVQEIVPYKREDDEYLRKPFVFQELYRKIILAVKKAERRRR